MATIKSFSKNTTVGGFPYGADQGMPFIAGAAKSGVTVIPLLLTATTTSLAVKFADQGLPNMANAKYVVIAQSEAAGSESGLVVDESTKTTSGFTILGTANTEVVNILVVGTLAGQSE